MDKTEGRATRALIYVDNIEHNIKEVCSALKDDVRLCVAVKANGYGCGAVTAARIAVRTGASYLAVATVGEGAELRAAGITCPILLMSMCSSLEVQDAVRLNLTPFVFDKDYIKEFARAAGGSGGAPYPVHLAVDTGMGRIGCHAEEAADAARCINGTKSLVLGGLCTHFAVADSVDESDRAFTKEQIKRFTHARDSIRQAGMDCGIVHCAESVALFDLPEAQFDMVRAGIVVYGYYPGDMTREYFARCGRQVDLRPVMALESEVCAVRRFKKGESISYGRTWTADKDTDIAVLPIGYADGLLRRFSPPLTVAINGKAYPVRGRVCMDQCMVDVGLEGKVKRGDKAIVFGPKQSGALQDAEAIACAAGTISYEIMTGISSRVPRVSVRG